MANKSLVNRILKTKLFLFISLFGFSQKVQYLKHDAQIENVRIQPNEAIKIAEPYLEGHATYWWNKEKPLETHVCLKGKYYYVMRTNYPAKTFNYYLQPAVKIHVNTGEVTFVEKD